MVGEIFVKTVTDFTCRSINCAITVVYRYGTFYAVLQNIRHSVSKAANHCCIKIDADRFLLIIRQTNKIDIVC